MSNQYPALRQEHLSRARLYADRDSMIEDLTLPRGGVIGEVGVALGDFSRVLIRTLEPRLLVAFDLFQLHKLDALWGRATTEIFQNRTHTEFYERAMAEFPQTVIEEGPSTESLARYSDHFFDLLYIDADHTYDGVARDAALATQKLKIDGVLVFNDYIMCDHVTYCEYGIVPVVNSLVVEDGWHVIGYALQHQLFCDIAIKREHHQNE